MFQARVPVRLNRVWPTLFKTFAEGLAKCLICKPFVNAPENLWITLFICTLESLDLQGFDWTAQKKSKVSTPYKSTTYKRRREAGCAICLDYCEHSVGSSFVHK
jgi:hypothetical protein